MKFATELQSHITAEDSQTAMGSLAAIDTPGWTKVGRVVGMTSKIAGEPHTPRKSWDPNRQICFAAWLTSTGPMHLRSTNGYHLRSTSRFAPVIRTRTMARILSISAVRRPCG